MAAVDLALVAAWRTQLQGRNEGRMGEELEVADETGTDGNRSHHPHLTFFMFS
jgi:hypothetical protein